MELKDCKTQAEVLAWICHELKSKPMATNESPYEAVLKAANPALTRMAEVARHGGRIAGLQEAARDISTAPKDGTRILVTHAPSHGKSTL